MADFVDYYELMQVHLNAESAVIKAAYKRLSHKYHPDNTGERDMITKLNEAYSILMNSEKREKYNKSWLKRYAKDTLWFGGTGHLDGYDIFTIPQLSKLTAYMDAIQGGNYEVAYQMLSKYNRQRIFKKDFIKWQKLVGKIHKIVEYSCTPFSTGDKVAERVPYLMMHNYMVFRVHVREMSHLLGRHEEEAFNRVLINEDGVWSVFLLTANIKKVIKKYERLVSLNEQKLKLTFKGGFRTSGTYCTGWISKVQFLSNLEHEQLRYLRYRSIFSVLVFHMAAPVNTTGNVKQQLQDILETHTRILDSVCQLRSNMILLLLPETDETAAKKTADKLQGTMKKEHILHTVDSVYAYEQKYDTVKELLSEVTIRR